MASPAKLVCVGAAHWDIIGSASIDIARGADVPGRVVRRPGGVALNVAMGAARLGCEVELCAALGDDPLGIALSEEVARAGIGCDGLVQVPGAATDCYLAIEDSSGALVAAVAATGLIENHAGRLVQQLVADLSEGTTVFVDANLPSAALVALARAAANVGAELVCNPVSPAKASRLSPILAAGYPASMIVNLAEANVLCTGKEDPAFVSAEDTAMALVKHGARFAVVTDGARPAAVCDGSGTYVAHPPALPSGASVTGAGDALLASYLANPDRHANPQAALTASLDAAFRHMTGQ